MEGSQAKVTDFRGKLVSLSNKGKVLEERRAKALDRKIEKAKKKRLNKLIRKTRKIAKYAAKLGYTHIWLSDIPGAEWPGNRSTINHMLEYELNLIQPVARELQLDVYVLPIQGNCEKREIILNWGRPDPSWSTP